MSEGYGRFKGRQEAQARELAITLVKLKDKAGRMGMYKTMHALDEATRAIGWEIAEKKARAK